MYVQNDGQVRAEPEPTEHLMNAVYTPTSRTFEFRWFVAVQAVSMIGNAMTNTALYWLGIHVAHGNALGLSGLAAAQFLPMLFLSRRAGLLAVSHRPGLVLAATTAGECAGALAIGMPLMAGWMTIWYLWALGFGIGCAQTMGLPAGQMLMLDLVGAGELRRGASVSSMVMGLSKIAGPGLAGFMIATVGTGPVFLADAASFAGVIAVLLWLARMVLPATSRGEARAATARRFRWVLDLPRDIQLAALAALLIGGFGYQFEITNPLMAVRVFHLSAEGFGLLGTLMAIGGIAGSYYSAHRPSPHAREFIVWSLVFGIAECVAAIMPVPWAYDAVMVVIGATITLFAITVTVYIRQTAEPGELGPALSAYNAAFIGFVPAGAFAVAGLAAVAGTRWALIVPGLIIVVLAIARLASGMAPQGAAGPRKGQSPPVRTRQ
jgi:MFS family permease